MSQSTANVELKNFSKGIITEVNPLDGDVSSTKVMNNWVLNVDGSVQARKSLVQASSTAGAPFNYLSDTPMGYYLWLNPENSSRPIIVVVGNQQATFYSTNADGSLAARLSSDTSLAFYVQNDTKFTEASGKLLMTSPSAPDDIAIVKYKPTDDFSPSITLETDAIKVNDYFGIVDGSEVKESTNVAMRDNQSTEENTKRSLTNYTRLNGTYERSTLTYHNRVSPYPSKRTVAGAGIDAVGNYVGDTATGLDKTYGSTEAPIGKCIINVTQRSTSRLAFMADQPSRATPYTSTEYNALPFEDESDYISFDPAFMVADSSTGGRFIQAAHQGRVFAVATGYATEGGDALSPDINSLVYYSQSIAKISDAFKAHSKNDLTSFDGATVLDTDGGYISIQGLGDTTGIYTLGASLIVSSNTGLWEISSDGLFTSSNYAVRKLTLDSVTDERSVILAGNSMYYWASSGIKFITPDERSGRLIVSDITAGKIDTLYRSAVDKPVYCSAYLPTDNRMHWMYLDGSDYKELIYDRLLNAFYTTTLDEILTLGTIPVSYNVIRGSDLSIKTEILIYKYNGNLDTELVVAKYTGDTVIATLVTNVSTFGDATKRKFANYLTAYFKQTEQTQDATGLLDQSSCLMSVAWDFADNISSNKYSREFQAYRLRRVNVSSGSSFDYGQSVVSTRNKVRGSGQALAVHIRTEAGKGCHLYGMNLDISGNTKT
jgi:hypothetical protein